MRHDAWGRCRLPITMIITENNKNVPVAREEKQTKVFVFSKTTSRAYHHFWLGFKCVFFAAKIACGKFRYYLISPRLNTRQLPTARSPLVRTPIPPLPRASINCVKPYLGRKTQIKSFRNNISLHAKHFLYARPHVVHNRLRYHVCVVYTTRIYCVTTRHGGTR